MPDLSDFVGKDQIEHEIRNGTLARSALFGKSYQGPKVFDAEKANGEITQKNRIGMKPITKAVMVIDALLLGLILYSGATYKGKSEVVPPGETVSHYAIENDIPTPVLMMRNGLAYPEQLKARSTFHIYHPGFRGLVENIYDSINDLVKK